MLKTLEFKSLTSDLAFKFVFSHENILKYFINAFLEYIKEDKRFLITNIEPQSYIIENNKSLKGFYTDIKATLTNGDLVFIEMYRNNFTLEEFNKSYAYMTRLFSNQIKKKLKKDITSYKNLKRVIGINFIQNNYKRLNNKLVNTYKFKNDFSNISITDNTIMYNIRLDLVKKIQYNRNEEKFITILRMINAQSLEEIKKYGKDDEIMEEILEYSKIWNEINKEDDITLEDYINEERKRSLIQGEKKEKNNIAKNMLLNKINIDTIIKCTGLTKNEILNLK